MKKMLLAYDASDAARRALDTAAELVTGLGASLTLVSVVPTSLGLSATVDPFDDETVHSRQLADAVAALASRGVRADPIVLRGDPAKAILSIVASDDYDTVIMGSRGRGTTTRILLGSVSSQVATHTRATVVIVQ